MHAAGSTISPMVNNEESFNLAIDMRFAIAVTLLALQIGPIGSMVFPIDGFAQDMPNATDEPKQTTVQQPESESESATYEPPQPDVAAEPDSDTVQGSQQIANSEPPGEGAGTLVQAVSDPTGIGASRASDTSTPDLQSRLIFSVIALSITTTVAVAISFYLYYWRRILLAQPNTTVPEDWAKYLREVGQHVSKLDKFMKKQLDLLSQNGSATRQEVSDMAKTFFTLRASLDEREAEIRRLKKGYDAQIFRKFLSRFIRVHQTLRASLEVGDTSKDDMTQVEELMADALDECDVQLFEPPLGVDWRRQEGIADRPESVETEDPEKAFQIAEVVEPGYRLGEGENADVIVRAKVRIFAPVKRED